MPRKPGIPQLTCHRASGRAVVRLNGRDHYLGTFGSPEAKAAYDRLVAEWLANGRRVARETGHSAGSAPPSPSVNEVLLAFWRHAERHYRLPDGRPTSEIREYRYSLRPVRDLYGVTPAAAFGPRSLAAVRQRMLDADISRAVINRRVGRIVRAFKWAAAEELVPVTVYQSLTTLAGLQQGRTAAREREPVRPVDPATVAATLPHLNRHQRAMVELQRLTGMRPGEVCAMTAGQIDRGEDGWLYLPAFHKTAYRGRDRAIPLGPKARAVLVAFLTGDKPPPQGFGDLDLADAAARLVAADAYQEVGRERDARLLRDLTRAITMIGGCVVDPASPLFSPRDAREERFHLRRANRRTKVQPSQKNRRKANPKLAPKDCYTPTSYAHAVQKVTKREGIPHWHPNQLRHLFATEVRTTYGLEAAQVLLGHSRADVTQVYAERDRRLAAKVAGEMG